MTDELEASAEELIRQIDEMGGMVQAIERGFPQREIQNAAYRAQLQQERGEAEVVGVNVHQEEQTVAPDLLRVSAEVEAAQVERLAAFRTQREADQVARLVTFTGCCKG